MQWQKMGIMEPEWYAPDLEDGSPALFMNWEETEWILCIQSPTGTDPVFWTGTDDIQEAQNRAKTWLEKPHQ